MRWTEEKLKTKIPAKIREELRGEGKNPDVRPTQKWLREHGYGGISGFARRNNMSVSEVLEEICGFDPRQPKPLDIDHVETRRLIKEWLETEKNVFNQWSDRRIQDARTHFRTMATVAYDKLGSTNLLRLVRATPPTDVDLIMRLFVGLDAKLETQGAQSNYTRSLERWAEYLALRDEIDEHKISEVRDKMGYTYERRSPEYKLKPKQIRKCWRAAESLEEKTLLVILIAAGTRRTEPTDIKISQLRLDRHDPYIVFDADRKTGPATVPIMAGVEVIEAWIEQIRELDHWDGESLFPSKMSQSGSRSSSWVNNTIEKIVKRAGVTFPDGEEPTPKSFRSFWYDHYISARQEWLSKVEMLADEQGVSSSEIIDLHYLTGKGERDHFRKFAESYFRAVFGEELLHGIEGVVEAREEERDDAVQKAIDDYIDDVREELRESNSDDDDDPEYESPTGDPISVLARARLGLEHASAAASDKWEHYPPSPKRGAALVAGITVWAASFGIFWAHNGVLVIDPISGDVTIAPGAAIGLILGMIYIVTNLPEFDRVEPKSQI